MGLCAASASHDLTNRRLSPCGYAADRLWTASEFAADAAGGCYGRRHLVVSNSDTLNLRRFAIPRTVFVQPFAQMPGALHPNFCTPADKLFLAHSRTFLPIIGAWQTP
nr:hypothetical protein BDOA9_0144760 [Bradyrhizobium sp. DOA9]